VNPKGKRMLQDQRPGPPLGCIIVLLVPVKHAKAVHPPAVRYHIDHGVLPEIRVTWGYVKSFAIACCCPPEAPAEILRPRVRRLLDSIEIAVFAFAQAGRCCASTLPAP
jgi:hypothetical protein